MRLLLVEDHQIVRRGLRSLIRQTHPAWEIMGEAGDGYEALDLALRDPPDLAIIDVGLPGLDGIELTRQLTAARPGVRVLLLTVFDDQESVRRGLQAGARGYLVKTDSEHELEAAITAVGADQPYFSAKVSEMLLAAGSGRAPMAFLKTVTAREREVMTLVAAGKTNRAIATALGLSMKTVESHRSSAMFKLDVKSGADLVRAGIRHGIIDP